MKIKVLMTGSDGNCCFVNYKNTTILIDGGFKTKTKMEELLNPIVLSKDIKLDAVIITHEHTDHFNPWTGRLCMDLNIPMYLSPKHYANEENRKTKYLSHEDKRSGITRTVNVIDIEENKEFTVGDIKIYPFEVYHDANKTFGFRFNDNQLCWVTDCGFMSENIKQQMLQCENLALEFNYDVKKLINSERHWTNKLRTLGRFGHMNIEESIKFLKNIKKEKHYKNLITLHSSYHHCDLEELREKLDNAKLNIENIWVSQREDNNFIELDDCES